MNTNSPAFLRAQAVNSKRARAEKDTAGVPTGASSAARTAHRLFPDGGLLEYSESLPHLFLSLLKSLSVDDRAISNEFITQVLSQTHSAFANFLDRAQDEDSLRRAIGETRAEMLSVIHKLHIFANYWEFLNKEYTSLKASLASFCSEPVVPAPEEIPIDDVVEIQEARSF